MSREWPLWRVIQNRIQSGGRQCDISQLYAEALTKQDIGEDIDLHQIEMLITKRWPGGLKRIVNKAKRILASGESGQ